MTSPLRFRPLRHGPTAEDETGIANIVVWPLLFEQPCRIVFWPA
jgi:hypothetical protein